MKIIKRPFVFICAGMSLDGKISSVDSNKQSEIASDDKHEMKYEGRIKSDAVMIGGRSIFLDDPKLTVKTEERRKKRMRLGKTPEVCKIGIISDISFLKDDSDFVANGDGRKIIFTTERSPKKKIKELSDRFEIYVFGKEKVDLKKAMKKLFETGIKSVMVEGGGELNYSLLKDGLVDEIKLKLGNLILGGRDSTTLVDGEGFVGKLIKKAKLVSIKKEKNWLILRYKIEK